MTDAYKHSAGMQASAISGAPPWLNLTDGLDAVLMVSGLLRQAIAQDPELRFNLVRRRRCQELLTGHPAIEKVGFPAPEEKIITLNYRMSPVIGVGTDRPYQILGRQLGLTVPMVESFYLPGKLDGIEFLDPFIPWGRQKVVILGTFSDVPCKRFHPMAWHLVVEQLKAQGCFVIQIGEANEVHIRGSYSLLGVLSVRQQLALLKRSDTLVTVDNYLVQAAQLVETPAVVLWGPTSPDVYGYPGQVNLTPSRNTCKESICRTEIDGQWQWQQRCPREELHCMNGIPPEVVVYSVLKGKN